MASADFSKPVVETLAKRSGNSCANPDCGALTCGPSDDIEKAIIIGEAAHIYGARPGGARYDAAMSDEQRSDITNAIWLCRNCHKKVDADENQYPAEILFEWRRYREREATSMLGKASGAIREKYLERQLEGFSDCSYLAQQIIIDKPDFWEYKLTIDLLNGRLGPVLSRWSALKRGLYVRPILKVADGEIRDWMQIRFHEVQLLIAAVMGLVKEELASSWGPPGRPGDPKDILRVCDLIVECAQQILHWEETIRFSVVPDAFEDMRSLLAESAGRMLDQLARIPTELSTGLNAAEKGPVGEYRISLVIDLPPDWEKKMDAALKKASASLER